MNATIRRFIMVFAALSLLLTLCAGCRMGKGYREFPMEEVQKWLDSDRDFLLVDVRTAEEYEEGHLPGAILVPIEEIQVGHVDALPDPQQTLLLYCWTGRRAEDSAAMLAELGYKDIYAVGGIVDWTGEVVTGMEPGTR